MAQAETAYTNGRQSPVQELGSKDVSLVTRSTKIATRQGEVAVEALRAGDEVVSRDLGLIRVRWVGMLQAIEHPIRVPAGALGRNVPARDCLLAPNSRIWMRGNEFETAFAEREVMVPVKDLVGWHGITKHVSHAPSTDYFLVLCDTPQILTMDGMQVEMRHAGADMPEFATVDADEMAVFLPELLALNPKSDKWRRRLDKHEAAHVVEVKKRA
ncbi:Hint domain-containing protein [Shimia sp.]|uniref:Hint domain-containing protein n=1 Tax=Shimia sp. TaxID=1954381 RepID=UPI003BAB3381